MYAKVMVDVPTKGEGYYTYKVPNELQSSLMKGMRVIVPFGRKKVEGFVTDIQTDLVDIDISKIKMIDELLDDLPVLSEEMLQLGQWMSERYFNRKTTVWQSMLPAGIKSSAQLVINSTITAEQLQDIIISELEREILNYLIFHPNSRLIQLQEKFKDIEQTLEHLKKMNYIEEKKAFSIQSRPQVLQYAKWNLKPIEFHTLDELNSDQDKVLDQMFKKAPKQKAIAKLLLMPEYASGMAVTSIIQKLGSTRQTLKAMENAGYITITEKEILRTPDSQPFLPQTNISQLTDEQKLSLQQIKESIDQRTKDIFLLHGVTGSGKTEVYIQAIDSVLKKKRQAIVLVPEISLTPIIVDRFKQRFGDKVAIMHSRLSVGERYDEWRRIRSGQAEVVIGARSAIFAPFHNIGIIIIDEEHEASYKQEETPRYDAREIAIFRAKWHESVIVLGSATPSVESYFCAQTGKYKLLELKERVHQQEMPEMLIVDMRKELSKNNYSSFSHLLQEELISTYENGHQSILFLNRRGHSNTVICRDCGKVSYCPFCHVSMTYHHKASKLQCHYCNHQIDHVNRCETCKGDNLQLFGLGTEKIEEQIRELLPTAKVLRMDVDTTKKKGSHQAIIQQFHSGKADILIGTQMVAKGLDFPNVATVGIISSDVGLNLPDFRAAEKTFQLITQVAGRAGRHHVQGKVIVQSYNHDHYSIQHAIHYRYQEFYQAEIEMRKKLGYPPFSRLVYFTVTHSAEQTARDFAKKFVDMLEQINQQHDSRIFILGPTPSPISKIKNQFRFSIILKYAQWNETSQMIQTAVAGIADIMYKSNVILNIDVNPQVLL
ncbi:primosomal protein N' [Desulfuribacillus stibiiarsenatis]|uniref:Replication restart protein PriA n=1 Tax=Desulfuribacillus stibiiarsenatis TaxID=1390249 RepID=A0A1E5L6H8_9FIRM|nr:primosomal protein N' [Desulfuribacillus stibiiarsenatis]OEH85750.1 primosomal protein N' [Desulfuribacillus stibiiarsenatis]